MRVPIVGGKSFFTVVAVRQRGAQFVPERVIVGSLVKGQPEAINGFIVLLHERSKHRYLGSNVRMRTAAIEEHLGDVEKETEGDLHVRIGILRGHSGSFQEDLGHSLVK